MKALSLSPEWAWLVCCGMPVNCFKKVMNTDGKSYSLERNKDMKVIYKNRENRNWNLPKNFFLPQRILIHTSKRNDKNSQEWLMNKGFSPMITLMLYSNKIPKGAIIGEVTITGSTPNSKSFWSMDGFKNEFILVEPKIYSNPIPYKGQQRFFEVNIQEAFK